jgi:hypothetical protein
MKFLHGIIVSLLKALFSERENWYFSYGLPRRGSWPCWHCWVWNLGLLERKTWTLERIVYFIYCWFVHLRIVLVCVRWLSILESDRLEGASNFDPWKLRLQILIFGSMLWKWFQNPYQSNIIGRSRQMLLGNQLSSIHMHKTNTLVSYLTKITKLRDQLTAIGQR